MTVGYLSTIFLGANIAFGVCESVVKRIRNEQQVYNAYMDSKSDTYPYPTWHDELIKNKQSQDFGHIVRSLQYNLNVINATMFNVDPRLFDREEMNQLLYQAGLGKFSNATKTKLANTYLDPFTFELRDALEKEDYITAANAIKREYEN